MILPHHDRPSTQLPSTRSPYHTKLLPKSSSLPTIKHTPPAAKQSSVSPAGPFPTSLTAPSPYKTRAPSSLSRRKSKQSWTITTK